MSYSHGNPERQAVPAGQAVPGRLILAISLLSAVILTTAFFAAAAWNAAHGSTFEGTIEPTGKPSRQLQPVAAPDVVAVTQEMVKPGSGLVRWSYGADSIGAASEISYRCSIDGAAATTCPASYQALLPPGRHRFVVYAVAGSQRGKAVTKSIVVT